MSSIHKIAILILCIINSTIGFGQIDSDILDDQEVFPIVENPPEFPGGTDSLKEYIKLNTHFPHDWNDILNYGKVYVKFIIDTNGNVANPKVIRGINPILDTVAVKIIKNMPKWKPGSQRGKLVKVSFVIPVNFDKGLLNNKQ